MGLEASTLAFSMLGGSAVTSAIGEISKAHQRANVLEKRARLQRIEAARQNQAAREQRAIGQQEAERRRRQGRSQRGAAVAAIGASGVQLEGTPTDVLADQALENELNANLATFEAGLRSRELRREQAKSLTQANQLESRADSVIQQGYFRAGAQASQKAGQAFMMAGGGPSGGPSGGPGGGAGGGGAGGGGAGLGGSTGFGISQ